jgi:hypothetical protein
MLITPRNIRACQQTFRPRAADALTSNDTFNAIADDTIPTGTLTLRAAVSTHNRIVLESDVTASSSSRAAGGRVEFDRVL